MSRTRTRVSAADEQDMRPEYRFNYRQARPNRFASRMGRETVAVVLDPDVAAVFPNAGEANEALRALAGIIQKRRPRRTATRRSA